MGSATGMAILQVDQDSRRSRSETAKVRGQSRLAHSLFSHVDHCPVKCFFVRPSVFAIQFEERERSRHAHALVAVHERLCLREVKPIRRGDVELVPAPIPERILGGGLRGINPESPIPSLPPQR